MIKFIIISINIIAATAQIPFMINGPYPMSYFNWAAFIIAICAATWISKQDI